MAPWAFRAALSGLPADEVRDILESDRCPQPDPDQDHTQLEEVDGELVIRDADVDGEGRWLRSDGYYTLASMR